ncbi:hypothetical protein CBR_g27902 [Chara braunii]|uniref:Reverse transcriptase domain-containing protein n=1 Tax=Chara braunii TaxID=69332 RepID=A0A388L8N4_CHABU|nr:hypothetical protein CBR_g27902 [Chara braunii]|eukprot:GBG78679.1 hypothetical protein CBR_g27902 [Chara braunii]
MSAPMWLLTDPLNKQLVLQHWEHWIPLRPLQRSLMEHLHLGFQELSQIMQNRARVSRLAHDQTGQEYLRRMEELGEDPPMGQEEEWWAEWAALHSEWAGWQARDAELWGLSSKVKWVRNAERTSKMFFEQMKKAHHSPLILSMNHPFDPLQPKAGNTVEVLNYVELFYKELYKEEEEWSQEDMKDLPLEEVWSKCSTSITAEQKEALDGPITLEEVTGVLAMMQKGKAPGPDGMPVEYLMVAAQAVLPAICEAFNSLFAGEVRPPWTFGQAKIILLYKKGSVEDIRNWRPISLLSAPYKLYAKVLANRVGRLLPGLIHPTQTGFVPHKQILANVLLIRQILEMSQTVDPPLATLFLDFEKAYDRVRWPFLLQGLRIRGMGEVFVKAVQSVLQSTEARIQENGFFSAPLRVTRSVRQGCPLSPALYILYVEHLHEMIKRNVEIKGFVLPTGGEVKSNVFADDTAAVSLATQQSVSALRKEMAGFEKFAGAKLNWNKSVAVVPVTVEGDMFQDMRTQDPGVQLSYLGIRLPAALATGQQLEDLLHLAVTRMVAWGKRAAYGVFGKVLIVNNAVSSTLWYAGAVSDPTKRAWKEFKKALRKFLWKDDPHAPHLIYRVRWEKLVQPRAAGGLGLLDPRLQVVALQMRTVVWLLLEEDEAPWKIVTLQGMAEAIRVHPADVEIALLYPQLLGGLRRGSLWTPVLEKWRAAPLRHTIPSTCQQILQQTLFGNRFIIGQGSGFPWQGHPVAFGRQWMRCGIYRIADIWDVNAGTWREEEHILRQLDHQPQKKDRLEAIKRAIP